MSTSDLVDIVVNTLTAANFCSGRINENGFDPIEANPDEGTALPACTVFPLSGSGEKKAANAPILDTETSLLITVYQRYPFAAYQDTLDELEEIIFATKEIAAVADPPRFEWQVVPNVNGNPRLTCLLYNVYFKQRHTYAYTYATDFAGVNMKTNLTEDHSTEQTITTETEE